MLTSRPPRLPARPPHAPADLLRQMLAYRASDRINATEALQHPFFQLQL